MAPCSVLCSLKHPQYCCSVNWRDLGYKYGAEINNFKKYLVQEQDCFVFAISIWYNRKIYAPKSLNFLDFLITCLKNVFEMMNSFLAYVV